jgi:hypothetical protein
MMISGCESRRGSHVTIIGFGRFTLDGIDGDAPIILPVKPQHRPEWKELEAIKTASAPPACERAPGLQSPW